MLQRRIAPDGPVFYVSPQLAELGVRHAFSTRQGGVSPAPFDSLNLGNPNGCSIQDDEPRIQENYHRLQSGIGCKSSRRCWVHQVHAADVVDSTICDFKNSLKADALVTTDASQVLSIRIADCVPILLADESGACVAAVHAGWRGVIAGVIAAAVKAMARPPIAAAIGPCIGFDAFEVGPEVLAEFERVFGRDAPIRRESSGKGNVDLRFACRIQLRQAGLSDGRIDGTDRCTFRDADEFFSHRRDNGVTGRMAALIAPRSDGSGGIKR
jgi:YfiH family protein